MEQRKLTKRSVCPYCTKTIAKHLIPINDNVKVVGIAYHKGKMVHPKCFEAVTGTGSFKENAIGSCRKLMNTGAGGEYIGWR